MSSFNTTPSEGLASAARILKEVPEARRTEPTQHLYQGAKYTPSAQTDIRKTLAQFGLNFKAAS